MSISEINLICLNKNAKNVHFCTYIYDSENNNKTQQNTTKTYNLLSLKYLLYFAYYLTIELCCKIWENKHSKGYI